jgi:hypothetical protein
MNITTYGFRNMVRVAAEVTGTELWGSWTDYRFGPTRDERIVTYRVFNNKDAFMDKLGKLMELAGIDAQSHGLRVTDRGYIKCNCVLPKLVKFN